MNNCALDQKVFAEAGTALRSPANVQIKSRTSIPEGSIMEKLVDFAFSIPDFRRTSKGNLRHKLGDVIILIILAGMSRCTGRADMIAIARHNLKKFHSMGMLRHGVPSEPTICRIENGMDEHGLAEGMSVFCTSFSKELSKWTDRMEMICVDGKAMR